MIESVGANFSHVFAKETETSDTTAEGGSFTVERVCDTPLRIKSFALF